MSNPVYLYDELTKEYIFTSKNRTGFSEALGRASNNIARYTKGKKIILK